MSTSTRLLPCQGLQRLVGSPQLTGTKASLVDWAADAPAALQLYGRDCLLHKDDN